MKNKQSSPNAPMAFMFLMPIVLMIIIAFLFNGNNYSPLDTYVKGIISTDGLNKAAYNDAVKFIDSINNK